MSAAVKAGLLLGAVLFVGGGVAARFVAPRLVLGSPAFRRRVSAGTFRGAVDGDEVVLQSALPLDDAVRVWVTDAQDTVVLDALLS